MQEVLVNRLGGLSLVRKSVVRLTDRPDMTLDVYRGRKTTMQQQQHFCLSQKDEITECFRLMGYLFDTITFNSQVRTESLYGTNLFFDFPPPPWSANADITKPSVVRDLKQK